ncbi:MAG: insulinase family protein [Gemmatimonadota bacterium]|nr:insulinase family protein [Gemmatimonadota bacterium]MDE3215001.1 insulinase family protein [Gemmatimonadota bacterium]
MNQRADTAPRFQRSVLANGLTVLSEQVPGVRSVSFGAWIRSASVHERAEEMGVSHLLEHMVFKGTERRTAAQIALSLEAVGGSLDAYTSREHTVYQARVLDAHLDLAADVIGDMVFHPALRDEDLTLERKVILEEIAMVDDTPDDLVFELHNEALWAPHPLGYSILGTRETVSRLGTAELRALHARAYHPEHMIVAAAGNVDHDRLLEILARTGWADVPRGGTPRPGAPPLPDLVPASRHVTREGAQTHVVVGSRALRHGDPRRHALVLLSMLMGGGMSSRLFQRVREELGLAYAVYTFQMLHEQAGAHGVYVGTAPETAGRALDAIVAELERVAAKGLPPEELAMGKEQLKGQLVLSLESPASRMYRAASVALYDEPYRTLDELLAQVDAVDEATVGAVAREFFDPAAQTVLSLGPGSGD